MVNNYKILRVPQVIVRTGLSRSSIYLRIAEGSFAPKINLGGRAIGFLESDVEFWIEQRISESRKEG